MPRFIIIAFLVTAICIEVIPPVHAQSPPLTCSLSAAERELLTLLQSHPNQNRPAISCNPILTQVARAHASDMGQHAYFGHVNPDGYGPNFLVEQAGYRLPDWWGDHPAANYVESIGAGYPTMAPLWADWMKSPDHSIHLLAQQPFYADQVMIGIGVIDVPNSPYGTYVVIITAPNQE